MQKVHMYIIAYILYISILSSFGVNKNQSNNDLLSIIMLRVQKLGGFVIDYLEGKKAV